MSSTNSSKKEGVLSQNILPVISARDYVPGREHEVLEAVQSLLVSSTNVVYRKVLDSHFVRDKKKQDEKKSDDDSSLRSGLSGNSHEMNPNEMDGIMDSMNYVCEVMQSYHLQAHNLIDKFIDGQKEGGNVADMVAQLHNDNGIWDLREVAKDFSTADFMLGTLEDEYPLGSVPILKKNTCLGPTADLFLGSLTSLLGVKLQDSQIDEGITEMDSKLKYLEDVQAVSSVCKSQLRELDTILNNQNLLAIEDRKPKPVEEFDTLLNNQALGMIFELDDENTMITGDNHSVKTQDVEDKAHPEALSYIQAARDKLAEYSDLAQNILRDEVRCVVSEYTCLMADTTTSDRDGIFFEPLRSHFNGNAYNMDFKTYLAEEKSNEMQHMLLDTLHSSRFLRNVGDKCQRQVRLHVGQELSVSICNVVMDSLMNSKEEHRMTEWGACLFKRHIQALHAYVYEFCQTTEGTEDLLRKVNRSSFDTMPMDPNWERLFYALDILKLESLDDYTDSMLHPLCTSNEARKILRLRTEFDDDAIRTRVIPSRYEVDERILG